MVLFIKHFTGSISGVEQGLTSHETHYRSYWGQVLWVKRPNQVCKSFRPFILFYFTCESSLRLDLLKANL